MLYLLNTSHDQTDALSWVQQVSSYKTIGTTCWPYPITQVSWCIKTCNLPLQLPPARIYRVGCITVREHTDTRHSPQKECTFFPVSWKTSTRRGWSILPTVKQSSCLGSHTAWNLVSHLPVKVLWLMVLRTGSWEGRELLSKTLSLQSAHVVTTRLPVTGEKYAEAMLLECSVREIRGCLLQDVRHLTSYTWTSLNPAVMKYCLDNGWTWTVLIFQRRIYKLLIRSPRCPSIHQWQMSTPVSH